jgi:acyl-coenzyme A synthetase/AMP-(fatty) acid ligase
LINLTNDIESYPTKLFFVDGEKSYSYDDLLFDINNRNIYFPANIFGSVYELFLNIIVALIHDEAITLIDSDISESEVTSYGSDLEFNNSKKIKSGHWSDIKDVTNRIYTSKSMISIFTSGTSGTPKKITHTINKLANDARVGSKYSNNIWGLAYNITHIAGLKVFLQALFNHNSIIMLFNKPRAEIYRLVIKYKITHISATPTFYRLLLPFSKSFNSVQRITFGGEKSNSTLYSSVRKIFPSAKVNNIYASTESGTLLVSDGDIFRINNVQSSIVKVVENELFVHKSMLGNAESIVLENDYYRTGDRIEWVDKKMGTFVIKGRVNNTINVGGYNVDPIEVAEVILSNDKVEQCIVYGRQNSVLGNILVCDITIVNGLIMTIQECRSFIEKQLQPHKRPRIINFVDSLSQTRSGKLKQK